MAVIAIDAGTSVIKAVAFHKDGSELALARATTRVEHPQAEFSEQSMDEVWNAARQTVREVCAELTEEVAALCITAQGDGCWLVDENGEPTGNALLWNDGRAATIVKRWRDTGAIERTQRISGSVTYPGLSNALLTWLQQNNPDRLTCSRWVLSCNGWLFAKLTGRIAADLSDASNPFSNVSTRMYSEAAFAAYEATHFQHMFPDIAEGPELTQVLSKGAAQQLGLPAGLPVTMAPYDIVTTAYGAGVVSPGQACLILGTTICAEAITREPDLTSRIAGTTLALDEGLALRAMPTLAGCETLEWTACVLGATDLVELGSIAESSPPGAAGLLFLPYLSEAGERSPFLDPQACGSWHGLKLTHRREHLVRAVYEGLSFVIRECLEAAVDHVAELRVCGGGARSNVWCQIIADVTNLPVLRSSDNEIGARGAFLYSAVMRGEFSSLQAAVAAFPSSFERFSPHGEHATLYRECFERFLSTRNALRPAWSHNLAGQKERA